MVFQRKQAACSRAVVACTKCETRLDPERNATRMAFGELVCTGDDERASMHGRKPFKRHGNPVHVFQFLNHRAQLRRDKLHNACAAISRVEVGRISINTPERTALFLRVDSVGRRRIEPCQRVGYGFNHFTGCSCRYHVHDAHKLRNGRRWNTFFSSRDEVRKLPIG